MIYFRYFPELLKIIEILTTLPGKNFLNSPISRQFTLNFHQIENVSGSERMTKGSRLLCELATMMTSLLASIEATGDNLADMDEERIKTMLSLQQNFIRWNLSYLTFKGVNTDMLINRVGIPFFHFF